MKYLYRLYQLLIAVPIIFLFTIITALTATIGCTIGSGHFWGYYPGRWWSKLVIRILLLPIKVEGREYLDKNQSYIFVSNHQGAFDIFMIYGYLNRNFKWMMKRQLRDIPLIGLACQASHHIFVDKRGPSKIKKTYEQARETLQDGMSLVVFPEGSRTFTGRMGEFKRGAFMLANDLQLPIVPLTINGSFDVKPRMRDIYWVFWHPMKLTIHPPLTINNNEDGSIDKTMNQCYHIIMNDLVPEYRGNEQSIKQNDKKN